MTEANEVIIHAVGDVGPIRIEYGDPQESLFANVVDKIR
jgi:hypothetical protein